jgi:hypothetical protein
MGGGEAHICRPRGERVAKVDDQENSVVSKPDCKEEVAGSELRRNWVPEAGELFMVC